MSDDVPTVTAGEDDFAAAFAAAFDAVPRGIGGFAADMRAQGIHVGLGSPARCVCCDEAWPCTHTRNGPPS